jgi:hypothetical protein
LAAAGPVSPQSAGKRGPNGTVWVMATYGVAQLMIILGIVG